MFKFAELISKFYIPEVSRHDPKFIWIGFVYSQYYKLVKDNYLPTKE